MCATKRKSYEISKGLVSRAYRLVKANAGAAGVGRETVEQFEKDLESNLYKIWNRMSSGSYFSAAGTGCCYSEEEWRTTHFRCADGSGSCGADGCQTSH